MSDDIVYLSSRQPAYSSPNFVIEYEGRLYVTVAHVVYDPKAENLSDEQRRGVEQMQKLFDEAKDKQSLRAARLEVALGWWNPMQSGPPPMGHHRD